MSAPRTKGTDLPAGIRRRHARACPALRSDDLEVCDCRPSYQAQAGPRSDRRTSTHRTLAAAKGWRRDTEQAFARGDLRGEKAPRFREFAEAWLADAERGLVLARGDKPFRASTLREYRAALHGHLYPRFGDSRLDQITRGQINEFAKQLTATGKKPQTVKNIVIPLRVVMRHAIDTETIAVNPTQQIRVPAGSGRRLRVIAPADIGPMLQALHPQDRPLWATAIFAGLRRGELMALRWSDVDLARGRIDVALNYDPSTGSTTAPKTAAGVRVVPVAGALHDHLVEHRQRAGARPTGLVFARRSLAGVCRGAARDLPFADQTVGKRAAKAWIAASIAPIGLHDGRHTFASLMIAAMAESGTFNPKVLQAMMGHASIQLTYDRYGHLFPGAEAEAGRLLDSYLHAQSETGPAPVESVSRAVRALVAALAESDDARSVPQVTQAVRVGQTWLAERLAIRSVAPDPEVPSSHQADVCRTDRGVIL